MNKAFYDIRGQNTLRFKSSIKTVCEVCIYVFSGSRGGNAASPRGSLAGGSGTRPLPAVRGHQRHEGVARSRSAPST